MTNRNLRLSSRAVISGLVLFSMTVFAGAGQIRVAAWNVSVYAGGRTADIQQAVFDTFQGRSMNPDVIIAQEIWANGVNPFLSALNTNTYNTSAHDWAAFYNPANMGNSNTAGNDLVYYYRTSKLTPVGTNPTLIDGNSTSGSPRDVFRGDFSIVGNANSSQVLALYGSHMKAGTSPTAPSDADRRNVTATAIRNNANSLGSNYSFIFGGDMNVQTSTEQSYQTFVGSTANNNGRFVDPIKTPGNWNAANAYRFVHTQAPSPGGGGMDDRFDQLLISQNLANSANSLHYVGDTTQTYSTTTWNDPNHSYRAWGNDGTSFNTTLTVTNNQMVGAGIAQALINSTGTDGGHLPVFLDLQYQATPEPATLVALGLGTLTVLRRRRQA